MIEVIGAGFGRTGTNSLQHALQALGLGPCYHMLELIRNPDDMARWQRALDDGPTDWADVFGGYRSTVDWPGCAFWKELVDAFPRAKVVLTVRDPESWYASARSTIFEPADDDDPPELPAGGLTPEAAEFVDFMGRRLLPRVMDDGRGGRVDQSTKDAAIATYLRHNAEVERTVPAGRLLVYRVGDGWEPLCDFLGVPVPASPFPHVNDSGSFRRTFEAAFAQRIGAVTPAVSV